MCEEDPNKAEIIVHLIRPLSALEEIFCLSELLALGVDSLLVL